MNVYGEWAIKAALNARQLAEESKILLRHKCKARAYYLAHMSVEESSKSIVLYAAYVGETPISEIGKVKKLLSNHQKKIQFVLNIAASKDAELSQKLTTLNDSLIIYINNKKNGTMYVSANDTSVETPEELAERLNIEPHIELASAMSDWAAKLFAAC